MRTLTTYDTRVQAVVSALAEALDAGRDLPDLAELAARAHFSPFHFQRLWRALTGETVGATVLRLRLLRAIELLADDAKTVTDVALAVGFGSSQALARVVREQLETTPTALRQASVRDEARARIEARRPLASASPCQVEVVSLSPFRALLQRAVGGEDAVALAYGALFEYAASVGLLERIDGLWGIDWDDRRDVPEAECRADCLLVIGGDDRPPSDAPASAEALATRVDGGRYARVRVVGPFRGIEPAIDAVLAGWLPGSGETLREAPILLNHLDDPDTTPEAALRTDVHVPLA